MIKTLDVFCEIPCLTENSKLLKGINLQKKWFKSADKRIIGQYLQKFIAYNSELFRFLNVEPYLIGTDQNVSLGFKTNEFIGVIPLIASDTGKQIGDLVIAPRFIGTNRFEDYIDIINLLGSDISPEIIMSLPLASGKNFRPPLYLEALKFITSLENLLKISWRKFDSIEKFAEPLGQVNWQKYFQNQTKVENRFRFPTRKNILSDFHDEYSQLRYVFDICKLELLSSNTPLKIKNTIQKKITFLDEKLYRHKPLSTKIINVKSADNKTITDCKIQANKILNHNLGDSTAWRVDFSNVFEKFVQHIFKEISKEIGGKLFSNFKIHSNSSNLYSWELKHIEPDAVYQRADKIIFIDAKYKSNLYNKYSLSESLKKEHRHDLHQILAYSSFDGSHKKHSLLCYPSNELEIKKTKLTNSINGTTNDIFILGIPLKKEIVVKAKVLLINNINLL